MEPHLPASRCCGGCCRRWEMIFHLYGNTTVLELCSPVRWGLEALVARLLQRQAACFFLCGPRGGRARPQPRQARPRAAGGRGLPWRSWGSAERPASGGRPPPAREAGLQPQDVRRRAAPERAWRRQAGGVRGPSGAQPRGRGRGQCGSLRAGPGTWRRGPGGRSGFGPAGGGGGPLRRRRSRSAMEQQALPPAPPGAVAGGRARRRRERDAEPPRVS